MYILRPMRHTKEDTISFRVKPEDRLALQRKADKYTAGVISSWVRYAALNLEPRPQDLTEVPDDYEDPSEMPGPPRVDD